MGNKNNTMNKITTFVVLSILISCSSERNIQYPITEKILVTDTYFNTTIEDPYRWLEDDYSKKTKAWVQNQNSFTDRYIRKIPFRKKIERRLKEIWDYPSTSTPFQRGDNIYFYKNDGLQNQSILYASNIQNKVADNFKNHYSPKQMVEIALTATVMVSLNLFNDAFRVPIEDEVVGIGLDVPEL